MAAAWACSDFVAGGKMSQEGYSALCSRLSIGEMSFESIYLIYCLGPDMEDVMTVCSSQQQLQRGVERLGCARPWPGNRKG